MHTQPDTSTPQDRVNRVLRHAEQDITRLVRECRNVTEYHRPAKYDFVFADYLICLRRRYAHVVLAEEMGFAGGNLTEALVPLPIWNDEYRWDDVLDRVCPVLARAA